MACSEPTAFDGGQLAAIGTVGLHAQEFIEEPPWHCDTGVGSSSRAFLPKLIQIKARYRNSIWPQVDCQNTTLWSYRRGSLPLGGLDDTDVDELSGTM